LIETYYLTYEYKTLAASGALAAKIAADKANPLLAQQKQNAFKAMAGLSASDAAKAAANAKIAALKGKVAGGTRRSKRGRRGTRR